ncbi:HisA/HisF-related TIM barrel protein [Streptomyces sp. NPDC048448]|uniref:HisA/HisF-related TIM barrel protein n=1 Tax=unclassified Streptomyces TaxID=2593676 RepID=UPI002E31BBDA|nr:HisA/HisF-related TIM barrel protein [Streptomyces sp. NBC_01462]
MPAPSPAPARRWRVNIDVQHGTVASHPGLPPGSLIADVLGDGVPAAVIDLDRSTGTSTSTALLETAVRRHPGRLWVGGRLTPGDPAIPRLLEAGAAGALIGSTGLFPAGLLQPANWPDFAALAPAGRLMLSVDALDGHVVTDGFTRPTGLPLDDALDALITATSSAHPILVTDAGAATRRTPPPWAALDRLAARHPHADLWYAGGLACWPDLQRLWHLGWGAVVGRAYLTAPRGLPDTTGHHHRTPPVTPHP